MSSSDLSLLLPGPADYRIFAPGAPRATLEREALPAYIARCRWFGGKARGPRRFSLRDVVPISADAAAARMIIVEIEYAEGATDAYLLPLQIATGASAEALIATTPGAIVARFREGGVLFDAIHDETLRAALFELLARGGTCRGEHGALTGAAGPAFRHLTAAPPSRALAVEQSNSSLLYGDHLFVKLYRRLEPGVNPDAEILDFLSARGFPHVPPFAGAVEYHDASGHAHTLALATGLVPNDGDAWSFTLRHLAQFYQRVLAGEAAGATQLEAEYLAAATQLGTRTGELHRALASDDHTPHFRPEPFSKADSATLARALHLAAQQVRTLLAPRLDALDATTRALALRLRDAEPALLARADALARLSTHAAKTRTHGDYHLGQVLHGAAGFVIIDFEGEPLRPLAERRCKMSPFRDVAGMLRSFHYAAHAALEPMSDARAQLSANAEAWADHTQRAFLAAWFATTRGAIFRDPDPAAERALLDAFLLEKALYEIRYEVNNRPAWLGIPLRGVLALLEDTAPLAS